MEIIDKIAKSISEQPASEEDFHVGFTEFFAGCLRPFFPNTEFIDVSAHKSGTWDALYKKVWGVLAGYASSEVTKASKQIEPNWCDALRYLSVGPKPDYLLSESDDSKVEKDAYWSVTLKRLAPLFNFAADPAGAVDSWDGKTIKLNFERLVFPSHVQSDDKKVDAEGNSITYDNSDESTMQKVRKIKLLMQGCVAENDVYHLLLSDEGPDGLGGGKNFLNDLYSYAMLQLAHPYKNLRDESNRVVSLMVKRGDQRRDYGYGPKFYADVLSLCTELKAKLLEDLAN